MAMRRAFRLALLFVVGCGGPSAVPDTVVLTLAFDPGVPPTTVSAAKTVRFTVSGAESFTTDPPIMLGEQLAHGSASIRYRPGTKTGVLHFLAQVGDAAGGVLASGETDVTLVPGQEAEGSIVLVAAKLLDGGQDLLDEAPLDLGEDLPDMPLGELGWDAGADRPDLWRPDLTIDAPLDAHVDLIADLPRDLLPEDLTAIPDLTVQDLVSVPDLIVLPSHYTGSIPAGCPNLTTATRIDTSALKVWNGATDLQWTQFTEQSGLAVLCVGSMTVSAPGITVVGTRPLVILARGAVQIDAPIHASADKEIPGPGGFPPIAGDAGLGPGAGGPGGAGRWEFDAVLCKFWANDSSYGGGGAGHSTDGGAAGPTGHAFADPKNAGVRYGNMGTLLGGSSGGSVAGMLGCDKLGHGGAGGGAIQITSATSITVGPGGAISASGGGAYGGCFNADGGIRLTDEFDEGGSGKTVPGCTVTTLCANPASCAIERLLNDGGIPFAGGGGGSGGEIFLEAPTIMVGGGLFANGGGGGAGASECTKVAGKDGRNGAWDAAVNGGRGGQMTGCNSQGSGGTGGSAWATVNQEQPMSTQGQTYVSGGGGGSAGWIWLRTRGTAAEITGTVSPVPNTNTGL